MPKGYKNPPAKKAQTGLLPVPKVEGVETRTLVDAMGGPDFAAQCLKVSRDLIDLWYSGQVETPFATKVAMYWQSPFGHATAFTESHWTHSYNCYLANEARARVEQLERAINAAGLPIPPGRLTTHEEMLLAGPEPLQSYKPKSKAIAHQVDVTAGPELDRWADAAQALDKLCTT